MTDRKPDGTEVLNVTENMSIPLQRDLEGSGNNSHVYMIGGTTVSVSSTGGVSVGSGLP